MKNKNITTIIAKIYHIIFKKRINNTTARQKAKDM